jgi:beta-N-acetylhexosaminidase
VHGVPLVMMSTAIYPALRSYLPAAVSPRIVRLLRTDVGFSGAIVTDALQTPEVNHYFTTAQAAVRAVAAGCDLVMAAGPTSSRANTDVASTTSYAAIVAAARSGRLPRAVLRAAYRRVLILKSRP